MTFDIDNVYVLVTAQHILLQGSLPFVYGPLHLITQTDPVSEVLCLNTQVSR